MEQRKAKIHKQALEVAEQKKCFFIDQLVSFLPISISTFYEYFPAPSEEMEAIKAVLNKNKIEVKSAMYNKWFKSDNPTLQIALMKIISTDEEAHRLNGTRRQLDMSSTDGSMSPKSIEVTVSTSDHKKTVNALLKKFETETDE